MMNNLYVNFNSLNIKCSKCGSCVSDKTLKLLANQIIYENKRLEEGQCNTLDYAFQCEKCKKIIIKKIIVERQKSF